MDSSVAVVPSVGQMAALTARYGLQTDDGVLLPGVNSVFSSPPEGKIGVYVYHLDAGYRLPTSDFMAALLSHYRVHLHQLVPNGVSKVVAFEMLCRSLGFAPTIPVFRHFFRFAPSSTGGNYTFCLRQNVHSLVSDMKSPPKDWAKQFFWVNEGRVGRMVWRTESVSDRSNPLGSKDEGMAAVLRQHQVVGESYPEVILAGAGMSTSWRIRGKMPLFFVKSEGILCSAHPPFCF